jgi:endonuclease/exonuclease/phosphatase family metal-dependent hydrolase
VLRHLGAAAVALIGFLSAGLVPAGDSRQAGTQTTVMSYNIRYGTANDGDDRWERRRPLLLDVIRTADADLIGVQEALASQIDEVLDAIPVYAVVGIGRDDGRRRGEYAGILFRASRFRVAESGTFWLSDTPDEIASTTGGNTVTRICTWARFIDRDGRAFWHYNVHLDHESQPSRERSTALLEERIASRPASIRDEPVIVTGDFNAGEDNPAIRSLLEGADGAPGRFVDTFRVLHPDAAPVGTFTAFRPDRIDGPKIDYILVEPGTEVLSAGIIRTSRDGRFPSDHFPVVATIRLR